MKTELYNNFYNILIHIKNIMNITNNEELKKLSKKTIINTISQLCEYDKNNKKMYEGILVEFGLKDQIENTNDNIEYDEKELDKLSEITEENILEKSLENNHIEEINNEIDKQEINNIEKSVENSKEDIFEKSNSEIKENNSNTLPQEKKDINEKYKEAEEYVLNTVYRGENRTLGDKFQNIMVSLIRGIRSDNKTEIEKQVEEYKKFINENSSIFDKEILETYLKCIFIEYKKEKEDKNKDNNIENHENEEGYKIQNIKKTFNSKIKNKALSLIALTGIGALTNPLIAIGVGVAGYKLYKKGVLGAKKIIEQNGLALDNEDNLIDSNGKKITEEDIGKLKYNLVKKELTKINNSDGKIDKWYKKNKLTSLLFNFDGKTFSREKITTIKNINDKLLKKVEVNGKTIKEEILDINKGMRLIK